MRISSLTLLPLITVLGACTGLGTNETLVVDGPKSASFQSDLAECRNLARQQGQLDAETGAALVLGAGLGALAGWADAGGTAGEGAIGGALGGAAVGAVSGAEKRQEIVFNCMIGRGHNVVG